MSTFAFHTTSFTFLDFHAIHTKLEDLTRTHDEVIPNNILGKII